MNDYHDRDLIGPYVLDALSPEEADDFEDHLATCSSCRAEVLELRCVVDVLPLAVDLVEPPASLRDRIVAELEPVTMPARERLSMMPGGLTEPAPRSRGSWRNRTAAFGLIAAVVVGALGVRDIQLQHQVNTQQNVAFQSDIINAVAGGARVSTLPGSSAGETASAALVQPRGNQPAYLVVTGLSAPPPNRVYQIWLIKDLHAPRSARVFTVSGTNTQIVKLPVSTHGFSQSAVTVEPGPNGSSAPTTGPVLMGSLGA